MQHTIMQRSLLAIALVVLGGCDWGERITALEQRADRMDRTASDLRGTVGALDDNVDILSAQVNGLSRLVRGRSRLAATVTDNQWRTIYGNNTGRSQMVRMTHQSGNGGTLELRWSPVAQRPPATVPGMDPPPVVGASEPLDLSPIGSQRIQRLMCGYEMQARTSAGNTQRIDILVMEDPNPRSCDRI